MTEENPLARSHQLLWDGLPESRKGPRPSLTLDRIVTTAVAIADAEGIESLSMRKLATELGVGTMSLYRYVPDKADLLNLMLDHVSAPASDGAAPSRGWRDTLTAAAHEGRELYLAHRWLIQVNWSRPVMGPNSIAGVEQTMAGLADLPFSDQEKIVVVSQLDAYVIGSVRQEILYDAAAEESGMSDEEFWNFQLPWLERAMASGRFPTMAAMHENSFDAGWQESFALGLQFMLDGIEREVARRHATDPAP